MANFFMDSTLPVGQNAVKNILFRCATIVLNFVVYRLFALIAFKRQDYTSFLMFAEDIVQKAFFSVSRKFNRQAILVMVFACFMAAAGFYDTLLWALDSPGYITKSTRTNAGLLSSQMLDSPGYVILLSNPMNNLSRINLNDTIGANMYATGLNFTLPGINAAGFQQVIPPVVPLSISVPPSIWLDSDGFAVGLDENIMFTTDMNTTDTFCAANNVGPNQQAWRCSVRNLDAAALFEQHLGRPQIWWDLSTSEYLAPSRKDNPWESLGSGADTAMMKQVFTVTKGSHRHTFLQTTLKTAMLSFPPYLLDDGEITDFIRRLWSTDPPDVPLSPVVKTLADLVIGTKNNKTSLTFGSFLKLDNITVASYSTEYLNVANPIDNSIYYAVLRFASTTIQLLRSEIVFNPPTPYDICDQSYTNLATGGVVRSANCYSSYSVNKTGSRFLGQIDTSSVFIISDILGDGTKNTSNSALDPVGAIWYEANADQIDQMLTSRALILGGVRSDVVVDVRHNEAALSYLQLFLTLLPVIVALVVLAATFSQPMSYFKNSFLVAVCATTHIDNASCEKLRYMRSPPDLLLKHTGEHLVIGTPMGGALASVSTGLGEMVSYGIGYEPLLLNKDDTRQSHNALRV